MENIEIDIQKSQFIKEIAELNEKFAIDPIFFSVLSSILIEPQGISQERIENLTRYSRGKISESLNELMEVFPIKKVKLKGVRTKFYKIEEPEKFYLYLYDNLVGKLATLRPQFEDLIKKMGVYKESHERFIHLYELLVEYIQDINKRIENYQENSQKFHKLYEKIGMEILKELKIPDMQIPAEVKKIDESSSNRHLHKSMNSELYENTYLPLKEEFFKLIMSITGDVLSSSKMIAFGRIAVELSIEEQYLSKTDIKKATGYKSTIIQQVLKDLVIKRVVTERKFENDRKKYYLANNRLLTSSFRKYQGVNAQVDALIAKIQEYKEKSDDANFKQNLTRIQQGYELYALYLKHIYYNLEKTY